MQTPLPNFREAVLRVGIWSSTYHLPERVI